MFFKSFIYDFKNQIQTKFYNYLILFAVTFIFCGDFLLKLYSYDIDMSVMSFNDVCMFIFCGTEKFYYTPTQMFKIPIAFLLLYIVILYFVLYYPYNDMLGYGKQVLVAQGSRKIWWLSKAATTVLSVCISFAVVFSAIMVFCLFCGIPLKGNGIDEITYALIRNLYGYENFGATQFEAITFVPNFTSPMIIISILILPLITAVALSLFQLVLSLIIKPFFSFIAVIAILIVSSYYVSPFAIGNYAMMFRSDIFLYDGVSFSSGIFAGILLSAISVIAGIIIFNRYDILNKG